MADELAAATPRVHVLHRPGKSGLGKAYLAGFRWALERDYDLIFEMDADFSHDPSYLPALIGARAAPEQMRRERRLVERWSSIYSRFNEVLAGIMTVKGYVMEEEEKRRFLQGVREGNEIVRRGVLLCLPKPGPCTFTLVSPDLIQSVD